MHSIKGGARQLQASHNTDDSGWSGRHVKENLTTRDQHGWGARAIQGLLDLPGEENQRE
jgi:uncharacterized protein YceK